MSEFIYKQVKVYHNKFRTVDPFELLKDLGATVVYSNAYPRDGLRGYCTQMNRIKYVVINAKLPEEEQRVVAAHEAGHLILHSDVLRVGMMRDMDVYNVTGKFEREANLFAADFLMNDDDVLELLHEEGADFINVARRLNVPAPFFAFKLYSMVDRGYNMRMPAELNSRCLK